MQPGDPLGWQRIKRGRYLSEAAATFLHRWQLAKSWDWLANLAAALRARACSARIAIAAAICSNRAHAAFAERSNHEPSSSVFKVPQSLFRQRQLLRLL